MTVSRMSFLKQNELSGTGKFHVLFLFFVSIMFSISLVSLWGYHIYLVLHNRTTLGESLFHPFFKRVILISLTFFNLCVQQKRFAPQYSGVVLTKMVSTWACTITLWKCLVIASSIGFSLRSPGESSFGSLLHAALHRIVCYAYVQYP